MSRQKSQIKKTHVKIPYDYVTLKTTKSRIEKGLLAIPVSLVDLFPNSGSSIYLINNKGKRELKNFTPYSSSSRECRIGGLKDFYAKNQVKDGDELVLQLVGEETYRIIPESVFEKNIHDLESRIDNASNEAESDRLVHQLSLITNKSSDEVLKNEFIRLSNNAIEGRKKRPPRSSTAKENVPSSLRQILSWLYGGKCQISGFTFLMKNGKPHFEIHHIKETLGNHFKNLLVVSPNVHAQFTFANVEHSFDEGGWLRKVRFNSDSYRVFQIIDKIKGTFEKQIHFEL